MSLFKFARFRFHLVQTGPYLINCDLHIGSFVVEFSSDVNVSWREKWKYFTYYNSLIWRSCGENLFNIILTR